MGRDGFRRLNTSVVAGAFLAAILLLPGSKTPLADAARQGDLDEVRALVSHGADVDAAHGDGMTALHWAAHHGSAAMVGVLVEAGATVDPVTRLASYTPLHLAARTGAAPAVEALVKAGADARARTATGVTPLHLAADAGSAATVELLIEAGADVNRGDDARDRTPLMFATGRGRVAAIRTLLAHGADVHAATRVVDFQARAEADAKERRDRAERIKAEEEAAARAAGTLAEEEDKLVVDPDDPDVQVAVAEDAAKEAPADEEDGAEEGDEEEKPKRLSYPDLVGKQGGMTALHYAVRDGRTEAVRLLLAAGADLNGPTAGDGTTPLLMAAINGHYDLAMELLELGGDPNRASEDGVAPLYAVLNNRWAPKALYPQPTAFRQQETSYLDLMRALLDAGADPNVRVKTHIWYTSYNFDLLGVNFRGATPFWRAAYATDVSAMRLLKEYGADHTTPTMVAPGWRNRGGDEDPSGLPAPEIGGPGVYPIHAATGVGYGTHRAGNAHRHVHEGWLAATRYLVEELGVDVNQRDHDGYSAVHHAAARGDNEVIRYLVEHGADVTFVSRRGQTTVDMANGPQQRVQPFPETIALLESLGAKNNHNCVSC